MTAALILLLLAAAPGRSAAAPARAAFEEAVRERLGLGAEAEVTLESFKPGEPELLRAPARLVALALPPSERGHGRVTAKATVVPRPGEAPRDTWIVAEVRVTVPTVVTTRRVTRDEILGPTDVTLAARPFEEGALSDPGQAIGRSARQLLAPGEALRAERLALPELVRRGDSVNLVVAGRAFRLATRGEALARGALGAGIPVRVAMTGRVVSAVVTGPGLVEVRP